VASFIAPWWIDGDRARCRRFAAAYYDGAPPDDLPLFVHARVAHSAVWSVWTSGTTVRASRLRRLRWLRTALDGDLIR
jgi:hypothetical protein